MDNLPQDPIMLLSVINTNLRDYYSDLDILCENKDIDKQQLIKKLEGINYTYDKDKNQFV